MSRQGLTGVVVGALVSAALIAVAGQAQTPRGRPAGADGLAAGVRITVDHQSGTLYVVDSERRWFGVYQVDKQAGHVSLKAARNFHADTELQEYGQQDPSVQAVRRTVGFER